MERKKVEFKKDVDVRDINRLKSNCIILLSEVINFCNHKRLPCVITSLITDRVGLVTRSRTHQDGRAFDISIKDWTKMDIEDCTNHFNTYYRNIAAISAETKKPLAAKYGDKDHLDHIHFQVRPDGT